MVRSMEASALSPLDAIVMARPGPAADLFDPAFANDDDIAAQLAASQALLEFTNEPDAHHMPRHTSGHFMSFPFSSYVSVLASAAHAQVAAPASHTTTTLPHPHHQRHQSDVYEHVTMDTAYLHTASTDNHGMALLNTAQGYGLDAALAPIPQVHPPQGDSPAKQASGSVSTQLPALDKHLLGHGGPGSHRAGMLDRPPAAAHAPRRSPTSAAAPSPAKLPAPSGVYECQYPPCTKRFSRAYFLAKHERTHTGDRPFTCAEEGCGKRFAQQAHLDAHLRTHTGERPYACRYDECWRAFTTASALQRHTRCHDCVRPHVCSYPGCGREFARRETLEVHVTAHTKEYPFVCQVCGKGFPRVYGLNRHVKTHERVPGAAASTAAVNAVAPAASVAAMDEDGGGADREGGVEGKRGRGGPRVKPEILSKAAAEILYAMGNRGAGEGEESAEESGAQPGNE